MTHEPGCTLHEAQANTAAVTGLTWPEQFPLPLARRVELWALVSPVKDDAQKRARLIADFRRQHLGSP